MAKKIAGNEQTGGIIPYTGNMQPQSAAFVGDARDTKLYAQHHPGLTTKAAYDHLTTRNYQSEVVFRFALVEHYTRKHTQTHTHTQEQHAKAFDRWR